MAQLKLKTGDTVMIMTGKDKGKKGKITQVLPSVQKVVVEGMNSMTKNIRGRKSGEKGQRVQFHAPIHISNVMFIDSKSGHPSRLGHTMVDNKKVRRVTRTKETVQ
jgi:large subunit ribosomal protein L24